MLYKKTNDFTKMFFFVDSPCFPRRTPGTQEDVNGEKLTVKKWWIFGADFFTVYADFSRFRTDINGEKKTSRY